MLLKIETVINKNVNVTKPYSVMKQQDHPVTKPKRWSKGVISGVSVDTTDDEVKQERSAVMARCITRTVDGEISPSLRSKTSCRGRSSSIFDATESNDTC